MQFIVCPYPYSGFRSLRDVTLTGEVIAFAIWTVLGMMKHQALFQSRGRGRVGEMMICRSACRVGCIQ